MNICKLEHHFFEGKRVPKHAGADFSQAGSLRADGAGKKRLGLGSCLCKAQQSKK